MKLNFAIICEHAFIDKEERLSIIQTFDAIKSNIFPITHPKLTVVAVYSLERKDEGKKHLQLVSIFNPEGERIAEVPNFLEYTGGKMKAQFISYFFNLPLQRDGTYKIKINLNERLIKELPLEVIKVP